MSGYVGLNPLVSNTEIGSQTSFIVLPHVRRWWSHSEELPVQQKRRTLHDATGNFRSLQRLFIECSTRFIFTQECYDSLLDSLYIYIYVYPHSWSYYSTRCKIYKYEGQWPLVVRSRGKKIKHMSHVIHLWKILALKLQLDATCLNNFDATTIESAHQSYCRSILTPVLFPSCVPFPFPCEPSASSAQFRAGYSLPRAPLVMPWLSQQR